MERKKEKTTSYNLGFNLSDANSVLVKYDGRSTVGEGVVSLLEGYPMNTIWGYETDGYWKSKEDVIRNWAIDREFTPEMDADTREKELRGWKRAVAATFGWAKED